MTTLSDTQLLLLSAAARRDDRNVLPLPGSLRGGAASRAVGALMSRGLIAECTTDIMAKADPVLNRVWRNDREGRAVVLQITDAGLAAIGVETQDTPESGDTAGEGATHTPEVDAAAETPTDTAPAPTGGTPRERTKQALLIAMLRAPEGATIGEIAAATGWQPHTVRGAIAGAVKKKLGFEVTSEKVERRGRAYKLPAA